MHARATPFSFRTGYSIHPLARTALPPLLRHGGSLFNEYAVLYKRACAIRSYTIIMQITIGGGQQLVQAALQPLPPHTQTPHACTTANTLIRSTT